MRCLALLLLFALLYWPAQSRVGLVGYDESAYAEVSREMLHRRDWIAPSLNGEAFFEKPPLLYWTQIAGYQISGVDPASARFGNGLAALALLAVLYVAAKRPLGSRSALLAVFILGTSLQFAGLAWFALTDMLLTLFLVIALACLHQAFERDRERRSGGTAWFLGAVIAASLAMLAKGLVGVALPAAAALVYLLSAGQIGSALRMKRLIAATAIVVFLGGSWYILVGLTHPGGFRFLRELLIEHHFGRLSGAMQGHSGPFFYYLPVLLLGMLPWSPMLVPAIARAGWVDGTSERGRSLRLFGIFSAIVFALFSISATKLPNYALPIFPFAALLIADWIHHHAAPLRRIDRIAILVAQVFFALLGAFALALPYLVAKLPDWIGRAAEKEPGLLRPIEFGWAPYLAAAVCFLTAGLSFEFARRQHRERALILLGSGSAALLFVLAMSFFPRYDAHFLEPLRAASIDAARRVVPGERLVLVGIRQKPEITFEGQVFTEFVAPKKRARIEELFGPGSTRVGLALEHDYSEHLSNLPFLAKIADYSGWVIFHRAR